MRRRLLLLGITAIILAIVVAAQQQPAPPLLILERALKATDKSAPAAILIELGVKDEKPADWSGNTTIQGAKVVHREGWRFRKDDKLTEPQGWTAKSHYSIRAVADVPVKKMEGVGPVGVVMHLAEIKDDAVLTVQAGADNKPEKVPLKKVLAGETVPLWGGTAVVKRISTATPIAAEMTENDQPAAAYGPDGTLWVAYTSYTLRDPERKIEAKPTKKQPENFKHLYHPEFAEQLWVRPYKDGKWGEAKALSDAKQDIARCAIAITNKNNGWCFDSTNYNGNHDIYATRFAAGDPDEKTKSKALRISDSEFSNLSPVTCVDSQGAIWVAFQSWSKNGLARIMYVTSANGSMWSKPKLIQVESGDGNCWHPAISAGPNGEVAVAFDVYRNGSYDVDLAIISGEKQKLGRIANSPAFQARPSICYDPTGKLWIAYEVGPINWGKDYGALASDKGNPLYSVRTVDVVCLDKGEILRPHAKLPDLEGVKPQLPFEAVKTNKFERQPRYAYPQIGIDGKGQVWLTYRRNFGSRYSSHPGAIWKTFARRLDGGKWTDEMLVHQSDGLLDHRPVLLPHVSGGLAIVHNTDGRESTPNNIHNQIFLSIVDTNHKHDKPGFNYGGPFNRPEGFATEQPEEKQVQRIKDYRIKIDGKTYQLLRGEFHRHTEMSWDGAPDGSLEDMFRYAIDAAAMDWIGNGDHDSGGGREYPWWLIQKWTDAYHVDGKFTPMFTYERSVSYPHGHRNCMFAKRGIMTLPRLAPPDDGKKHEGGVHPDDTKMLYKYLHELDGICASHTSATGMGTDWRNNDPVVEPIVELYQGDRMSYEYPGAPRSGYDPKSGMEPANVGGWKPLGFVNLALKDKGYKLGFQASSDHWSTHISYCIVIAEKHDRDGILAAVKKRHCYAATDNIIVDLRSGDHIQGDEFTTTQKPTLEFTVIGTGKIAKIDVLKDSEVAATLTPNKQEFKGEWSDAKADGKTHYYYIRVLQADGEIAWASPIWITKK